MRGGRADIGAFRGENVGLMGGIIQTHAYMA